MNNPEYLPSKPARTSLSCPNMLMAGKNLAALCRSDIVKVYIPLMVKVQSWVFKEDWRKAALTIHTNHLIDSHGMELMMIANQCDWTSQQGWHQADFVHYITSSDLGWHIANWILGGHFDVSREELNANQLNLYSKHCRVDPSSEEYGLGSFRFACGIYAGMFHNDASNKEAQKAFLFAGHHSPHEKLWPSMSQEQILRELNAALL